MWCGFLVSDGIASFPCPGSCGARVVCCDTLETLGLVRRITCIPSWDDDGDGCRFGLMRESSRNGMAGIGSDVRGESTKSRRIL